MSREQAIEAGAAMLANQLGRRHVRLTSGTAGTVAADVLDALLASGHVTLTDEDTEAVAYNAALDVEVMAARAEAARYRTALEQIVRDNFAVQMRERARTALRITDPSADNIARAALRGED